MLYLNTGLKLKINQDLLENPFKPTWRVRKTYGNKEVEVFMCAKSDEGATEVLVQLVNYHLPSEILTNIIKTFLFSLNFEKMNKKETRILWAKCASMMTYRRNYTIRSGDILCLEFTTKIFEEEQFNSLRSYINVCNIECFRFMRKEPIEQPPPYSTHLLTMENQFLSKICNCHEQFCSFSMFFNTTNVCANVQ